MAAAKSTVDEFKEHIAKYIKDHGCYGYRVVDSDLSTNASAVEFVPPVALKGFWTPERVNNVLWSSQPRIRTDPTHLREKYIVILSILVWMGQLDRINIIMDLPIDDTNLPITDNLIHGTQDPDVAEFLRGFSKFQWQFCPLTLDSRRPYKKSLHPYHILPITSKELMDPDADDEGDVVVYRAQWHRSCLGSLPPSFVVLKEYSVTSNESEAYKMLENEFDFYANLGDNDDDFAHIVRYYGSFVQQGRFTLVLEYASQGTLADYFRNTPHPSTPSERERFWRAFFDLLLALQRIHDLGRARNMVLRGVHQDIRPQNILCFPASPELESPVIFKLADFGSGHVRKVRERGLDALAAQQASNGMYSSPEANRDDNITRAQYSVGDVWSLGAVASEALVWTINGNDGRLQYQQKRIEVTRKLPRLAGGYHEGCFHDGTCPLDTVQDTHDYVLSLVGDEDTPSGTVSEIILKMMLIANPPDSYSAREIYERWMTYCRGGDCATPRTNSWQTVPATLQSSSRLRVDPVRTRSSRRSLGLTPTLIAQTPDTGRSGRSPVAPGGVNERSPTCYSPNSPSRRTGSQRHSRNQAAFDRPQRRSGSPRPSTGRPRAVGSVRLQGYQAHLVGDADESVSDAASDEKDEDVVVSPHRQRGDPQRPPLYQRPNRNQGLSKSTPAQLPTDHSQVRQGESAGGLHIHGGPRTRLGVHSEPVLPTETARPFSYTPSRPPATTTPEEPVKIAISNIYRDFILKKDRSGPFSKGPDLDELFPDLKECLQRLKGMGNGRDQYFLIDDSASMAPHREYMARTVRVLAYLLKHGKVDPDRRIELFFSRSTKQVGSLKSSSFERAIETHQFAPGPCGIAERLDEIATRVLEDRGANGGRHGASVYVLTNGRWDARPGCPEDPCGVDHVVGRFVDAVRRGGRQANYVGIQFVRFYDSKPHTEDAHGEARLRYLDDELGKQFPGAAKGDIVDATDWDGDVRKLLLGGILRDADEGG
ncbi:kinase-like domain-containing protein [Podospora conica]|nr:kinase-like domain-containing protein [Schizothecium conicum]